MALRVELKDAVTVRAVLLVLGVLALQVLFIVSYVGALHHPKASNVPFGLVSPDSAQLAATLNGLPDKPLDVRVTDGAAAARSDVLDRTTYGALIVDPDSDTDTLLVAPAAAPVRLPLADPGQPRCDDGYLYDDRVDQRHHRDREQPGTGALLHSSVRHRQRPADHVGAVIVALLS